MAKPRTLPPPRQPVAEEVADVAGATRERVRLALIELAKRKEKVTIRALRIEAACDQNAASRVLRAHQAGRMPPLFQPWDDSAQPGKRQGGDDEASPSKALAVKVRAAQTDGEREAIAHELAALVADGDIDPAQAREIRGALAEARQAAEAKRATEPPPEDPTRLLMATEEAMQVAQAVDWIVDEARRARVVAFVQRELESDMLEHPGPSPDAAGVGR